VQDRAVRQPRLDPAAVEVLADHLLEEHAAGMGSVEDLGQGELRGRGKGTSLISTV